MASKLNVKSTAMDKVTRFMKLHGEGVEKNSCVLSMMSSTVSLINTIFVELLVYGRSGCSTLEDSVSTEFVQNGLYILDFITKIKFLKISHVDQNLRGDVNISYFKSITTLELQSVPPRLVVGLNNLPKLKSLVCNRSLTVLKDLLGPDGEEVQQEEILWSLEELNVSGNFLENLVTLVTVPNVNYLDTGNNKLKNVHHLTVLDKLVWLNLDSNQLQCIPALSSFSSSSLKVLIIKNNKVEDLTGLELLKNLHELDISSNHITEFQCLKSIKALKFVKNINMRNNPVTYHDQFSKLIIQYFHENVTHTGITLDGKHLTPEDIHRKLTRASCAVVSHIPSKRISERGDIENVPGSAAVREFQFPCQLEAAKQEHRPELLITSSYEATLGDDVIVSDSQEDGVLENNMSQKYTTLDEKKILPLFPKEAYVPISNKPCGTSSIDVQEAHVMFSMIKHLKPEKTKIGPLTSTPTDRESEHSSDQTTRYRTGVSRHSTFSIWRYTDDPEINLGRESVCRLDEEKVIPESICSSTSDSKFELFKTCVENVDTTTEKFDKLHTATESQRFEASEGPDGSVLRLLKLSIEFEYEELDLYLKADVVDPNKKEEYTGILAVASKSIYIMKLMSEEQFGHIQH